MRRALIAALLVLAPARAWAQPPSQPPAPYVTPSGHERIEWIVDGTVGPRSLVIGVVASAWQTALDFPDEWGQTWRGFGQRYAEREADVAISNTIQAGLGSIWGEEMRYIPSGRHGVWPRLGYALKTVLLAQRPDGHLTPAWGRYAGNVLNNVIENAWLPPSATTARATTLRGLNGLLGRTASNIRDEFWPDLRERLRRTAPPTGAGSRLPGGR